MTLCGHPSLTDPKLAWNHNDHPKSVPFCAVIIKAFLLLQKHNDKPEFPKHNRV